MFDSFKKEIISFPSNFKMDGTVTEYRAPTDDSIRLAEEFREKLQKEFITRFEIPDNEFNLWCDIYQRGISIDLVFRFKINNKEFVKKFELSRMDFHTAGREGLSKFIQEKIANILIEDITYYIVKTMMHNGFNKVLEEVFE